MTSTPEGMADTPSGPIILSVIKMLRMGLSDHLLCVLGDHQNERKVVHSQRKVKQRVGVREEDNVLHGVFNQVWCAFWVITPRSAQFVVAKKRGCTSNS